MTGPPGVATAHGITLVISLEGIDCECWDAGGGDCHQSECHVTVTGSWQAPSGTEVFFCQKTPGQLALCEHPPILASGGMESDQENQDLACGKAKIFSIKVGSLIASSSASCGACG